MDLRARDAPSPARPEPPAQGPATRAIRVLIGALIAVQALIALVNFSPLVDSYAIGEILDVNRESTAVVWFTSALLWTIALFCGYAAAVNWSTGEPKGTRIGWLIIASGFVVLSVDETSQLHERVGEKVSDFVHVPFLPSLYSWVLVVAPIALAGAVWMVRWFVRTIGLRCPTTKLVIAAVGLWTLVPVLETLDPTLSAPDWLIILEETCETMGGTLFLAGVLVHLRDRGWLALPQPTDA
jgi:hypothetical protein